MENKLSDVRTQYYVQAREELAKANAEVETQRSVIRGREDSLTRLNFTAPVRGIVQDIDVTTVGGVIAPGGKLMTIVPLDEQLLIEAKISPRDVAFIHPGQKIAGENNCLRLLHLRRPAGRSGGNITRHRTG